MVGSSIEPVSKTSTTSVISNILEEIVNLKDFFHFANSTFSDPMKRIKRFFRLRRLSKRLAAVLPRRLPASEPYEIPLPGPPQIFKLNVDCFDEIFDYLSLSDLHNCALTCRAMQRIAGAYFKDNYKSTKTVWDEHGFHTVYDCNENDTVVSSSIELTAFRPELTCITREFNESNSLCNSYPFSRAFKLHRNEFTSLNQMCLDSNVWDTFNYRCLENILPQLEVLRLLNCSFTDDFYEWIVRRCKNLKELYVQDDNPGLSSIFKTKMKPVEFWGMEIVRKEQFYSMPNPTRTNVLSTLLEKYPNIHTLSIGSDYLWKCRHELLECNAKLDKLKIHGNLSTTQELCSLLNQLHERGFYRILHIFEFNLDEDDYRQLTSLESLSVKHFKVDYLTHLTQLKELTIWKDGNDLEIEMELIAKSLGNLQTVFIDNALLDDVLQFIRYSANLRKIRVTFEKGQGALDLQKLNDERKMVPNACKVAIYVTTDIFLSTKWTAKNGNLDLNFIEIRRADWNGWDHYYDKMKT